MDTASSTSSRTPWLIGLYFASGFSALLYQVAWQRMLGLFAGSDVRSATIVVTAYLAGLAVGGTLGSLFSDRLDRRTALRLYGWSNLGITVFAFASKLLFYDLLYVGGSAHLGAPAAQLLVAFVSLLWPTMLMGLSLPLISRGLVYAAEQAPALVSRLNGINLLGAAFGALLSGFVLVGNLGYDRTVYLGGGLNALVALGTLFLAGRSADSPRPALPSVAPGRAPALGDVPGRVWGWCGLVLISGYMAISLEILWLRVLGSFMQATPYLFATVLFCFLSADGAGTLLGLRGVGRNHDPRRVFMLLQAALALYALLSVWLVAVLPADGLLGLWRRLAPLLVVFVPGLIVGIAFPFVQKAIQTDVGSVGQRVSLIQTANIFGNVAAGLLTGLVLLHFLGSSATIRIIGLMGLLFAAALWIEARTSRLRRWRAAAGALTGALALAVIAFPSNHAFWAYVYQSEPEGHFYSEEDSTGVVVVRPASDRLVMYANGLHQGEFPATVPSALLGLVPALTHPNPERVMVIGLGSVSTAYSVGANPQAVSIWVVEIMTAELPLLEALRQAEIGTLIDQVLTDPRYQVSVGDGRRLLAQSEERFDIIESDAVHFFAAGAGTLFSREFYTVVRDHLAPGGLMCHWAANAKHVEATFTSVFPYVVKIGENLMLGSSDPIPFDREMVLARLNDPALQSYLQAGGADLEAVREYLREGEVRSWTPDDLRPSGPLNTDLHPRDEYYLNNPRRSAD